jgi:hypothetical protein
MIIRQPESFINVMPPIFLMRANGHAFDYLTPFDKRAVFVESMILYGNPFRNENVGNRGPWDGTRFGRDEAGRRIAGKWTSPAAISYASGLWSAIL